MHVAYMVKACGLIFYLNFQGTTRVFLFLVCVKCYFQQPTVVCINVENGAYKQLMYLF